MLMALIITNFVCWILGFVVNGFTLYSVITIVPTVMFAIKKFGIFPKMGNIIACEVIFLFFSITWRVLFHKFSIVKLLLTLLLRAIAVGVAYYDSVAYVYTTEEKKKR